MAIAGPSSAPGVSLGALLRHHRLAAGLTQEALAERAGVSERGVRSIERGAARRPHPDTVTLLANALGLTPRARAAFVTAASCRVDSAPADAILGANAVPALVGRAHELELLDRHLAGEVPPLLALSGQPGIGKSRLLQEAAQRAMSGGWRVLQGGCRRRDGQDPFTPLLDALEASLHGRTHADLRADLAGCAWLVRLLPELAGGPIPSLPDWRVSPEQERRLMYRAVERFLANMAGPSGILLLLDDVQWAGADTLDLLAALMRAVPGPSCRVVCVYRDTEVYPEDPLAGLLADLARAGLAAHQAIEPLASREARHLLDDLLEGIEGADEDLRHRLLRRSGGVPYFLISCVRGLRAAGSDGDPVDRVPWDLARSIRQRAAALPDGAREILALAAVIGRAVPRPILLAAAEQSDGAAVAGLEAACHGALLEETGEDGYRFVHDAIREVLEADLSQARRVMLHRRVAVALEALPGVPPIEALAYHYQRGDMTEKAIQYLAQAAEQALHRHALAAAGAHLQELIARLDALGRDVEAAGAREKLAFALRNTGRLDEALDVQRRAADTYRAAGDLERCGAITSFTALVEGKLGRPEQGIALATATLDELLSRGRSRAVGELYLTLWDLYTMAGQRERLPVMTWRIESLARELGDPSLRAWAAIFRARLLGAQGQGDEEMHVLAKALPLAEATKDPDVLTSCVAGLAFRAILQGKIAESDRYADRAVAVVEEAGLEHDSAGMLGLRGWIRTHTGDWRGAEADLRRALALHHAADLWVVGAAWTARQLGALRLAQGAWSEAADLLEEAITLAARIGDPHVRCWANTDLAEVEIGEGRPDAARSRLLPLLDDLALSADDRACALIRLVWSYLAMGEADGARAALSRAREQVRAGGNQLLASELLWVEAMSAIREDRWTEAVRALEDGLSRARSMPWPYLEGRLEYHYGLLHATREEWAPAREHLDAALAIFDRLGAQRDSALVRRALAALAQPACLTFPPR